MGHDLEHVWLTSGMILRPDFYQPAPSDRAAERRALGLDEHRPTGVVMFGGHGSMQMRSIARALADVQLILLCGHNRALADSLKRQRPSAPHVVLGFTPEVHRYLRLGDFFIGKPGPGALSEALHCGLPVITFRNAWTMPQERYNTQWVLEQGVGVVLRSTRALGAAVDDVCERLPELRARVRELDNRAVFELPAILDEVMLGASVPISRAWRSAMAPI
jgi:UDP-N-acetylglucosamine:LPS N-acetylglucosamine transferase